MDQTLEFINGNFISLSSEEMKRNNAILKQVLENIVEDCCNGNKVTNDLFRTLYCGIYYGGSYYDGLKVHPPNEYDIDIKLKIPYKQRLPVSNRPGFVNLKLERQKNKKYENWSRKYRCRLPYYGIPGFHVLANYQDDYLDTNKVMLWMHQLLSETLGGKKIGKVRKHISMDIDGVTYKMKFQRRGPAFTFRVCNESNEWAINFDLVPCFVFGENQWPIDGFRDNPIPEKSEFFIVPKPIDTINGYRYWRMSFQEQERVMLNRKERLKPVLRLIKKLRDTLKQDVIASYYIKTIFLWEVKNRPDDFWDNPLSSIFIQMLRVYEDCVRNRDIKFFWYSKNNLLEHIDQQMLCKISKQLLNIINDITMHPENNFLVAKYLLNRREMKIFRCEFMM